jgi:outer membrane receptor protein involved in Fe transport
MRRARGAALLAALLAAAPARGEDAPAPEPGREPAVTLEEIVVTATRSPRPARDVPAAVTVLPRAEIERSPTKTTDELLRTVPSFGLFRRSSSVAADPSSQGVNLRGIGPSGVSRSLVLVDGVPANDPFGGWVYWRAVPRLGLQLAEVVPGGGSALYGNYALGGVTQVFSRPITDRSVDVTTEAGSYGTGLVGVRGADRLGRFGASLEAELFRSDGYFVVAGDDRGAVDRPARSDHATVSARLEGNARPGLGFTLRGSWFQEDQNGGTEFTTAGAERLGLAATARWASAAAGALDVSLFGSRNGFDQERARISADRSSEALAAVQEVPATDLGAAIVFTSRPLAWLGRHTLGAGVDLRRVDGETREDLFPPTVGPTSVVRRVAGGEQRLVGVFAQDLWDVTDRLGASFAIRLDGWRNLDASRVERLGDGSETRVEYPGRSDDALSPKVGLLYRPAGWATLRASAYGAFRAPTLNELYRPFQVGTVRTEANDALGPEKLRGAEAGLELSRASGLGLRATGFWNELEDPITNVTIDASLRQRQNLGRARIRGVEAEGAWRIARAWSATAAYTFVDSEVTEAPGQPQLVGKELPQDPRHRASVGVAFDDPRVLTATVGVRYLGSQYEDDQNTLPMGSAVLLDVSLSRRVVSNLALYLAVENVLDEEYLVGRAGVDTIGQPRFVHGGVKIRTGG